MQKENYKEEQEHKGEKASEVNSMWALMLFDV